MKTEDLFFKALEISKMTPEELSSRTGYSLTKSKKTIKEMNHFASEYCKMIARGMRIIGVDGREMIGLDPLERKYV